MGRDTLDARKERLEEALAAWRLPRSSLRDPEDRDLLLYMPIRAADRHEWIARVPLSESEQASCARIRGAEIELGHVLALPSAEAGVFLRITVASKVVDRRGNFLVVDEGTSSPHVIHKDLPVLLLSKQR